MSRLFNPLQLRETVQTLHFRVGHAARELRADIEWPVQYARAKH